MNKKQSLYIILSVTIISLLITFIDGFLKPDYLVKSIIKIFLFLIVPIFYFFINKTEIKNFKTLFEINLKTMLKAFAIGIGIYIVILGGYFLTKGIFNFSNVTDSISQNNGINEDNFLYVSLYISFINSFLEEFFFRGFGFITLKKQTNRKFAYIFSSLFFSIYHVGMLIGMFDCFILPILFIGLFAGGCIFNYLNESSENIYTSWGAHMFANFSINTVAFILFGIV